MKTIEEVLHVHIAATVQYITEEFLDMKLLSRIYLFD